VAVVAGSNSNGITLANPAWITTYAAQTNQTQASGNIAGVGTTFAGTNVTATMALNSAGLALSLSAPAGGGGADGYNSAQFTNSTANSTMPLVWAGNSAGSGNVTIGLTGSTITMSAPSGGGAGDGGNVIAAGGSTAASTGTVEFGNANNVSFGLNAGTVTASASYPAQTVDTNKAGVGYTSTTQAGSTVGATHNTAGLSMAWPPFLTTAGATNAITTAAQSNHSHNFATTTTNGANIIVGTTNSAGATIGVPAFLTTAALSQNTSNYAGVGTTFAGTNATATLAANTNGVALSLSVAGGGTINQTGPNIAVAGSTVTSGDVVFSNSNGVTFGMNGSTVTASVNAGGGGATVGGFELFPLGPNTVFSTLGQNTINFQKFIMQDDVSFNNLEFRLSGSSVSSTNSQVAAHSYNYGIYARETGASSSRYSLLASSQMVMQASFSSNVSAGFTVQVPGTTFTSTSAGTAVLSAMTGFKHLYMPFTSTLSAGGQYAVAMHMSSATTGGTSPLRLGIKEQTYYNNLTIGRVDVNAGFQISATSRVGDFALGIYNTTSAGLPSTLAVSGLTNAVSQARMYIQFEA
jgi:hypothetical protein